MQESRSALLIVLASMMISIGAHWTIFNADLIGVHLWRQSQNEWYVRNFMREDNNILNPRIPAHNLGSKDNLLRYEFPLMQWSIAQVKQVVGDSIWVTRSMMFLIGLFCIWGIYLLLVQIWSQKIVAALTAWTFCYSPVFYYYMINPMSDIWALCAQIWMMVWLVKFIQTQKFSHFIWSAVFLMLAGLFKLPFFMFGIMLLTESFYAYLRINHSSSILLKKLFVLFAITIPVAAWYIFAIKDWGYMGVLKGVTAQANLSDLFVYFKFALFHWLPLHLVNVFAMIFLLIGIWILIQRKVFTPSLSYVFSAGMIITLLYYVYEINMIAKVHDYYMLPFLVWLHLGISVGIRSIDWAKSRFIWLILFIGMPVYAYLKIKPFWNINRNGYKKDWFNFSADLKSVVPRDSLCIILNDNSGVVVPYVIDHQGYVFDKDDLPAIWVEDMILNRRATYMYSDSRKVDTSAQVAPFIDTLLLQKGEVKVFRLVDKLKIKK